MYGRAAHQLLQEFSDAPLGLFTSTKLAFAARIRLTSTVLYYSRRELKSSYKRDNLFLNFFRFFKWRHVPTILKNS